MREPDYHTAPPYKVTLGPEVADLCTLVGFEPYPEQRLILDDLFAVGPGGRAAAFEVDIISARQQLKTGLLKQAALGWMFLTREALVIWSAHEFSTSREAFLDLAALVEGSDYLRPKVAAVLTGAGSEAIRLVDVSPLTGRQRELRFKARTKGGGRGLTGHKVILDEAFALQPLHMGALLPTLTQVPNPQVVAASSAGLIDSAVLRAARNRGRAGVDPRQVYVEWVSKRRPCGRKDCRHGVGDPGCALDDRELWERACPVSYRKDPAMGAIAALRQSMPPVEFMREILVWWEDPTEDTESALPWSKWLASSDPKVQRGRDVVFGADVASDRSAWVAVAWYRNDGKVQVQLVEDYATPAHGLVRRCAELVDMWGGLVVPPRAFEEDLRRAEVKAWGLPAVEFPAACTAIEDHLAADSLRHGNQQSLNDAVLAARWRVSSKGEKTFELKDCPEVAPLIAATRAVRGLAETGPSVYEDRGVIEL